MKLTAKAGAGHLVRELINAVDENGNPKAWNTHEMDEAVAFINMQVDRFDKGDAIKVMRSLMKKFQLSPEDIHSVYGSMDHDEDAHVRGLQ